MLQFSIELGPNTGCFANESVRQRPVRQHMKSSIHQHRMSVCQRLYASHFETHLARQWMKEREISCMTLSSGYTYLVVCLAPQWIKERGIIDMRVRAKVALYAVV